MREAVRGKGFGTPYGRGVLRATVLLVLLVCLLMLLTMWGCSSPGPDTTPPAAVSDLAVAGTRDSSLTVTWTAPGDDDSVGTASAYEIRTHDGLFGRDVWDQATPIPDPPVPAPAGTVQEVTLTGFAPDSRHLCVLMKAVDEDDNWSDPSNIVRAATRMEDDVHWWPGFAPPPQGGTNPPPAVGSNPRGGAGPSSPAQTHPVLSLP